MRFSWDWGAIGNFTVAGATIFAAYKAVSISDQWRIQKRSEIVSEIAKKAYKGKIVYQDKIKNLYPKILTILGDKDFNDNKEKRDFRMDNLVSAMKELTEAHIELISDLGIISKYYSNESIESTINNLILERKELDVVIFKVLSIATNQKQLSAEEHNEISKRLFDKTNKMKK
ncbi:hypothetical protein [Acinetobacter portensis]|uniref:hypothetical protein n=1 Tax=Acinetobacter portensis TaxID=1839785 RepID=UPI0013D8909A|nr:hypothetical protein [Acinetobacter portensis]